MLVLLILSSRSYEDRQSFVQLHEFLKNLENNDNNANRIFYFAVPPHTYTSIAAMLVPECISNRGYGRVVIEKPFGHDSNSYSQMTSEVGHVLSNIIIQLHTCLGEERMYRIDHYLGKEMVQNLMVMRFANTVFEALWSRKYISGVLISLNESHPEAVGK